MIFYNSTDINPAFTQEATIRNIYPYSGPQKNPLPDFIKYIRTRGAKGVVVEFENNACYDFKPEQFLTFIKTYEISRTKDLEAMIGSSAQLHKNKDNKVIGVAFSALDI